MKAFHSFRTPVLWFVALCLVSVSPAHGNETYSSTTQVKGDSSGDYQSKTTEEATDENGTTQSTTSKDMVDVDANGDTEVSKSTKKVTDPPGLFNTTTAETSETKTAKANGNFDSETVSKSENANGTADKTVDKKTVRVDSKGHRKTKVVHRKTHDPAGLMNQTTRETTDTSEQKDNGQVETTHETTVNGRTTDKSDKLQ